MLQLHRVGGMGTRDNERLVIEDDGAFTLWRTVATATRPPTPVGRSAGELSQDNTNAVAVAVATATGAGPGHPGGAHPGSAFDRLTIRRVEAEVPADAHVDGSWADAYSVARRLLRELAMSPVAGVDLALSGGGSRLIHVGAEPIELDLSELVVRAARIEDGAAVDHWESTAAGPSVVVAEPGWFYELPFAHGFGNVAMNASVEGFLLDSGGSWVIGRVAATVEAQ